MYHQCDQRFQLLNKIVKLSHFHKYFLNYVDNIEFLIKIYGIKYAQV